MGSKNHEVVPTTLIVQLSGLRGGSGVHKSVSTLAKANLIARMKNAKCTSTPQSPTPSSHTDNFAQMTATASPTAASTTSPCTPTSNTPSSTAQATALASAKNPTSTSSPPPQANNSSSKSTAWAAYPSAA